MLVKRIPAGIYAANCYVITDEETKETAVIDPGGDEDDIASYIHSVKAVVRYIILTHGHADHTGAALQLRKKYDVPLFINKRDLELINKGAFMFGKMDSDDNSVKDASEDLTLKLGKEEIKFLETPGHTPGGICCRIQNMLFTGDTLFAGSVGRTDLSGGDFQTLISSIKNKIMSLPEEITVYPGHGPQTSVGRELHSNPFL